MKLIILCLAADILQHLGGELWLAWLGLWWCDHDQLLLLCLFFFL